MHDDESMDRLLKSAFAAEPLPRLSPTFEARVLRKVKPRRLSPQGRALLAVYAVLATVGTVWLIGDLPVQTIALAAAVGVPVLAVGGLYGRRLVGGG